MTVQTVTHITVYNSEDDSTIFVDRYDEEEETKIQIHSNDDNLELDIVIPLDEAVEIAEAILHQVERIRMDR